MGATMALRMAVTALVSMLPLVVAFQAPTSLLPAASHLSTIRSSCLRPGLRAARMQVIQTITHSLRQPDWQTVYLNYGPCR